MHRKLGFTLIELLVVMAIIGVLATIITGSFRTSQTRGRDAQRKSDLRQIAGSVEVYYADYNKYPDSVPWGAEFTDGKTIYFKKVPTDPHSLSYYYRVSADGQKYQIFAHLENSQDKNIDPVITARGWTNCGQVCNFGVSSSNTTPVEDPL